MKLSETVKYIDMDNKIVVGSCRAGDLRQNCHPCVICKKRESEESGTYAGFICENCIVEEEGGNDGR